ncbi:secreted RxLR effector protein 161-like [Silene latifolia]|uniref:secreted RxLR effector protein 161-like n=1 Tax=Silene latifolia TaxID=37657 RepID=UPI003D77F6DA
MTQPEGFQVPGKEDFVCKLKKSLYGLNNHRGSDDMLMAAESKSDVQKLKGLLSAEFEMKDLGAVRNILGMEIYKDRSKKKRFLSYKGYIQKVLSRPDLAQSVSVVSRFMGDLGKEHWKAMKRISRFLKGTSDVGLIYGGDRECLVSRYSDSDYAGDVDSRRSMTGYVFTLGGSVVSWKATFQPTVTFSTTKAEYIALTAAGKEGIWFGQ